MEGLREECLVGPSEAVQAGSESATLQGARNFGLDEFLPESSYMICT